MRQEPILQNNIMLPLTVTSLDVCNPQSSPPPSSCLPDGVNMQQRRKDIQKRRGGTKGVDYELHEETCQWAEKHWEHHSSFIGINLQCRHPMRGLGSHTQCPVEREGPVLRSKRMLWQTVRRTKSQYLAIGWAGPLCLLQREGSTWKGRAWQTPTAKALY